MQLTQFAMVMRHRLSGTVLPYVIPVAELMFPPREGNVHMTELMVWSAAETLTRGLTTGKRVVSCPAAPPSPDWVSDGRLRRERDSR